MKPYKVSMYFILFSLMPKYLYMDYFKARCIYIYIHIYIYTYIYIYILFEHMDP